MLNNEVILGDCLDKMQHIPDDSTDMVILDPPYGTTPLHWDTCLDFNKLWVELSRICKDTTPILIFGQEPFSSLVRCSNMKDYKYDWYWEKERLTNVFQVKRRPGKTIETISVFYKKQCVYNPQKTAFTGKPVSNKIGTDARWSPTMGGIHPTTVPLEYKDDGTRHPTQVIRINRDNSRNALHPTQKPVELYERLIKTYTNEGSLILDPCAGSGTTGVACKNLNRGYILIERELEYYEIIKKRLEQC